MQELDERPQRMFTRKELRDIEVWSLNDFPSSKAALIEGIGDGYTYAVDVRGRPILVQTELAAVWGRVGKPVAPSSANDRFDTVLGWFVAFVLGAACMAWVSRWPW